MRLAIPKSTITSELRRFAVFAIAAVLVGVMPAGAAAQAARPNISALVYSADGKGVSARIFDPLTPDGRELFKLNERFSAIVSTDAQWVAAYGTVDDAGTFVATYGRPGDPNPKPLPLEKGFTFIGGKFSPTSKYFVYTGAKLPEQPNDSAAYSMTLVELATGAIKQYAGTITYPTDQNGKALPTPPLGFYGGPITVGWLDDNRQVVAPFLPFTDAALDGLYVLDLTNAPPGALPPAAPLTKEPLTGFSYKVFSADNTKLAYAFSDPQRPVPNYEGPYNAFNTVGILDFKTGSTIVAPSPKDNAVGNGLAFTPDGKQLYFNVGPYVMDATSGATRLQGSKLLIADTATGQVTDGPSLLTDTQSSLNEFLICGSTLYFTASRMDPNTPGTLLLAAPLADLAKQTTLYNGNGFLTLLSCTP